jgi:hypothetical protein
MAQGCEQKGAKLPTLALRLLYIVTFEQPGEEALGQILRILRAVAASPDIRVERIPISAAELLKGRGGLRGILLPCRQDTPVSRGKNAGINAGKTGSASGFASGTIVV